MKWIKASERTPNEWNSRTIVRFSHTKLVLHEVMDFLERYPHRLDTLEWLDESPESKEPQGEEALRKRIADLEKEVAHWKEMAKMQS